MIFIIFFLEIDILIYLLLSETRDLKYAFHAFTEKLRNPSLISTGHSLLCSLFFFLLLPVYPSRPLPSRRPPPCPRDLPRAPHFPPLPPSSLQSRSAG